MHCLKENAKERYYSHNLFFRYVNNIAEQLATICDIIFDI